MNQTTKSGSLRILNSTVFMVWAFGAMSVLFFASQGQAQERPQTEDLLPETTVLFVQIDNWKDMVTKMQESSMFKMLRDEKIAPLVDDLWDEAQTAYREEMEEQVGLALEDFQNLPHGEITFAMVAPRRKTPEVIVIIQTDPESESVDRVLDRGRQLIEENGETIEMSEHEDGFKFEKVPIDGGQFKFFRKDGLIVGSTSDDELDNLIERWMGREVEKVRPLSENRKFITVMNRCRGTKDLKPEARFYIDPIEFARSATRGDVGAQIVINFLPTLGLDGLLAAGGSMLLSEDEFASLVHMHVMLAEPRNGVFQMFAFRPTDYQPESWIPKDAINYMTTSWDIKQMLAELTKIIETFQEEGVVDRFFTENIDEELGFDFREEFLYNLTGRVTFVQWLEEPIAMNSATPIFAFEVKDPEKMAPLLEKILERTNRDREEDSAFRWSGEDHRGVLIYAMQENAIEDARDSARERRNERRREQGQQVYEVDVEINPIQPSFALVGNYLIFSQQSRKAIERAIDIDQGESESLVLSKDYQRVAGKMTRMLKTDMPSAMFYSDPRVAFRWMFELAKSENSQKFVEERATVDENRWAGRLKGVMDKNPLPEFSEIEHYFQPQGGYMTSDESGLHFLIFELRAEDK